MVIVFLHRHFVHMVMLIQFSIIVVCVQIIIIFFLQFVHMVILIQLNIIVA